MMASIKEFTEKMLSKIDGCCLVSEYEDHFEIDYAVNKKGKYFLTFSVSDGYNYSGVVSYLIICEENPKIKSYFPKFYDDYYKSDMILYEPKNGLLIKDSKVNFKVYCTTYKNLCISFNGGSIEMDKTDDNFFIKENVVIKGKEVEIISTNRGNEERMMMGLFKRTLVEYKVKDNNYNILNQFKITKNNNLQKLPEFSYFDFKNVIPNIGIIKSDNIGKITLNCKKSTKSLWVIGELKIVEGDDVNFLEKSTFTSKYKNRFEVEYFLEKKGYYFLELSANYIGDGRYQKILTYKLICEKNADNIKTFPKTTNLYNRSNMILYEPKTYILNEGDKIKFRIYCTTFDNIVVLSDVSNKMEMEKKENGILELDDVPIFGTKFYIGKKVNNGSKTIIEYKVNQTKYLKYPHIYGNISSILYEPITDVLKKGENVKFKVKCSSLNEILIKDGSTEVAMNKEGNIFTLEKKITGDDVIIGYKIERRLFSYMCKYDVE